MSPISNGKHIKPKSIVPINDFNENSKIYCIMKFEHLLKLLENYELTLTSPHTWNDPFEQLFLNIVFRVKVERMTMPCRFVKGNIFCQCWTRNNSSDAFWQVFSKDMQSIKIETTYKNLSESIKWKKIPAGTDIYFGKVKYLSQPYLEKNFKKICVDKFLKPKNYEDMIEIFLIKRKEYQHEQEFRLIAEHSRRAAKAGRTLLRIPIDHSMLDLKLTLDSRASAEIYNTFKEHLLKKHGLHLQHSDLYRGVMNKFVELTPSDLKR